MDLADATGVKSTSLMPSAPDLSNKNNVQPENLEKELSIIQPLQGPSPGSPEEYPDGGWKAWLAVYGAWSCTFASFGWISSIGVFQAYYSQHQLKNYSASAISWILSIEAFMLQSMAPVFGYIFDSYGPRSVLLCGTCMHIFGIMMASISKEYYQFFLAQGVCSGIATSALFYGSVSTVSTWFYRRRALAVGIVTSGASTGGLVLPIVFNRMIRHGISFGWTMRTLALVFLILLVPACICCTSRLTHTPKPFDVQSFVRPYREPAFRLLIMGSFFFFWAMYVPANFIIIFAERKGVSSNMAGYLIAILNSVSIVGRITSGWIADRYGRFNMSVVIVGASAVLILGLWIPADNSATIIAFSAAYGLVSGAFIALVPAMVAQLSDIRQIGVRQGTLSFNSGFASLTGNPIGGALLQHDHGGFTWLQVFCGVSMFAAGVCLIAARAVQSGRKFATKV